MAFRKTKSFGPKVALTDLQAERLETMVVAAGPVSGSVDSNRKERVL